MKRTAVSIAAMLLSLLAAPATQVVYPPLNRDTIVGTWEAISVDGIVTIERIEISKDGPSFFAYQIVGSPAVNIFRMIACDITDTKITLRFREQEPPGGASSDWFFEGTGEGTAQEGAMSGYLGIRTPPAATDKKNAFFRKGSWTRAIAASSRSVEESIRKARDEAAR
jgi:hypothetical protein